VKYEESQQIIFKVFLKYEEKLGSFNVNMYKIYHI